MAKILCVLRSNITADLAEAMKAAEPNQAKQPNQLSKILLH